MMKMSAMKAMKASMKKMSMKKGMKSMKMSMKVKTASGLTKASLKKSKSGKIVSIKKSAAGKKAYKQIAKWNNAVVKARKALNTKGFVAVGGKSAKGQALLAK